MCIFFLAVSPLGYILVLQNLCTVQQIWKAHSVMYQVEALQVLITRETDPCQESPFLDGLVTRNMM